MRVMLVDEVEGIEVGVIVTISSAAQARVFQGIAGPVASSDTQDELQAAVRRRLSPAMRRGLDVAGQEILESLVRFACERSEELRKSASVHPAVDTKAV